MSFTKTLELKKGGHYPDIALASAPSDTVVEVVYEVVAIELVTATEASARYVTKLNDTHVATIRFEFPYDSRDFIFDKAEEFLEQKLS